MKITQQCPTCGKTLELDHQETIGSEVIKYYKCGHAFGSDSAVQPESELCLDSVDGKFHARPYQESGIEFICGTGQFLEYANVRGNSCIIGDQMRLGKTPQSLLAVRSLLAQSQRRDAQLRLNGEAPSVTEAPVLILARAANMYQWTREVRTWATPLPNAVWLIQGTKNWIPPGFQFYICSMDTFSRRGTCQSCKHQYHEESCTKCLKEGKQCRITVPAGDAMSDVLLQFGFKYVIADEAHSFKNTDSQRSQALTAFLKNIERSELIQSIDFNCPMCKEHWQETMTINVSTLEAAKRTSKTSHCPKCYAQVSVSAAQHVKVKRNCEIILLTGTPIKNRADEYFVPLNLVAPSKFPSLAHFKTNWIDETGKRIKAHRWESFKAEIAPFVLRREKEDVYKELPKLNRIFTPITIEDERLKKAYNRVIDIIESNVGKNGNYSYFSNIGELQQLRQIAGLAKVNFVSDYAETFLLDSDRHKLAIGYHHHSVRDSLRLQLDSLGTCKLDGQDSPQQKDYIAHKYFQKAPEQILLLGMMAAKEGLELPYIDTALVCEREWSSADEEQFEYRFYNPDIDYLKARGLENKVTNIEYIVAKGTVDEFFYDLVEEKRQIFGETLSNNWDVTTNQASFKELIERTVAGRL